MRGRKDGRHGVEPTPQRPSPELTTSVMLFHLLWSLRSRAHHTGFGLDSESDTRESAEKHFFPHAFVVSGTKKEDIYLTFVSQSASTPDTTATCTKNTPERVPVTSVRLPTNISPLMLLAPASKMHPSDAMSLANSADHHRLDHLWGGARAREDGYDGTRIRSTGV